MGDQSVASVVVGNFTATLIHSKISLLHTFVHTLLYFFIDDVRQFSQLLAGIHRN